MESSYLLIGIIVLGFGIIIYFINKKNSAKPQTDQALLEWVKSTQASVEQTNRTLQEVMQTTNQNISKTLQTNTNALNERLDNAARVIAGVQKDIGEMSEIGRGMKDFQELLRSPKLRGNIGEQVLKELLGQMLPKSSFHLQYSFKSGSIVDAAIKTEAGIIPIDSKFPMENFRKMNSAKTEAEKTVAEKEFVSDVKKHVDAISKKYILTHEGTIDYALMYIPSEAIYYEIVNNTILFDYAAKHKVLPVSPMTFYAYLKAILMGFEGQKISQKAREILAGIKSIQKEYENLTESVDTLSKHITNSYNTMSHVQTKAVKLGQKIQSTSLSQIEEEPLIPEIPKLG